MLKLEAGEFYVAVTLLQETHTYISAQAPEVYEPDAIVDADAVAHVSALATNLLKSLEVLDARVTAIAVRKLIALCQSDRMTYASLKRGYEHINSRLEDELSLVQVFVMSPERVKYFQPKEPLFGSEFADKFPQAIPDMEDAAKCLAFDQGTAAVYHLMRVMEHGLKAIGTMLDIPYAPSWEAYLRQIRKKCDEPRTEKDDAWRMQESFFRDVESDLTGVKIVWRNPTMHVQRRFSVQEAEEIFAAVRAFMKRIAPSTPAPTNVFD
jgi:hypothetical protein